MSDFIGEHVKAVVFDFDDTLVGTQVVIWEMLRHIGRTYYERELTDQLLKRHWGQPLPVLARNYYQTDEVDEALAKIMLHQPEYPKAKFEHSEQCVRQLKQAGKIIGIVSATTHQLIEKDAALVDLPLGEFDYVQTAESSEFHKPDPKVFDPMLQWMGKRSIAAHEILYVGDGLHDMRAATAAGLQFIGVTTGIVSAQEFAEHHTPSIADLSQLTL